MGLRAATEVPPMFVVTNVTSGGSAEDAPRIGIDIRGTRKDVRIEDIVAAMGPRRPDAVDRAEGVSSGVPVRGDAAARNGRRHRQTGTVSQRVGDVTSATQPTAAAPSLAQLR